MNVKKIINEIQLELNKHYIILPKKHIHLVILSFMKVITDSLLAEKKIKLPYIGNLFVKIVKSKKRYNSIKGKKVEIKTYRKPYFKFNKSFYDLFNNSNQELEILDKKLEIDKKSIHNMNLESLEEEFNEIIKQYEKSHKIKKKIPFKKRTF